MNLHGNKRNASLLLILLSLGAMIYGIYEFTTSSVDCGGQVMRAGQVCETTSAGTTQDRNIEQQRTSNTTEGIFAFVLAGLTGAYGARNLIQMRNARIRSAVPADPPR